MSRECELRFQAEARQREVQECEEALEQIQEQKKVLWERIDKRKAELEAEQD